VRTFIYRCPTTGLNVQGWSADASTDADDELFEPVTCTACTRVHLVNRKTQQVLGADNDPGVSVVSGSAKRRQP